MSKADQYEKHPDECDHPEEQIENVVHIGAGLRPRCSQCGFHFMIIGEHERVIIEGETFKFADFECRNCSRSAKTPGNMSEKRCIPKEERRER